MDMLQSFEADVNKTLNDARDKSGNIAGTGLGVSIVKELMGLMGGRMQVVSALGQGTTVTLWLSPPTAVITIRLASSTLSP